MMRIDVPIDGDSARLVWKTRYYSATAIFSLSLSDEASVMFLNKTTTAPARLTYAICNRTYDCHPDEEAPF